MKQRTAKACRAGFVAGMLAITAAADAGPDVVSPVQALANGTIEGRSLGDWTAQWWRWALAREIAPYRDRDGRLCALGQEGPVWFLAGTDGRFVAKRECAIPEGKHVLVPIINMIYWRPRGSDASCHELQASAAVNNDRLVSAVALLDGQPLGDLRSHRVRSDKCFRLDPDDPQSRIGAADGYWLMLKPLPRGRHVLSIGANYAAADEAFGGMHQNFEYVLDIGGPALLSDSPEASASSRVAP